MNHKDLWLTIIKDLEGEINRANVITWFKNTAIFSIENGILTIGLPLPIFLDRHAHHYAGPTLKAAQKHYDGIKQIAYEIDITLTDADSRIIDLLKHFSDKKSRKLPGKPEVRLANGLVSKIFNQKYSLDNFIIAPENRLAHAAAMSVAKYPGANYNPFFVYGGVGLGKTHLLQAIGREILRNDPSKIVMYTTTETFTNELIDGIQKRSMEKFRNKYRKIDAFIIDDIQFIANKDRTQEEFFHTFNTLYEAGKQIIISSDRPPSELKLLSDRLVSRFESGMIVDVKMPDYESRLAILKNHCMEAQVFISDQVLDFIALNIDMSVRTLIGVLNQAIALYELEKTSPTIRSVTDIIKCYKKDIRTNDETAHVTIEERSYSKAGQVSLDSLADQVAEYFEIPKTELLGECRAREYVVPRQIVMYIAKTKLRLSLVKIGQGMGNRNHTTVMNAVSKITSKLKSDRRLLCDINAISKEAGIN